MRTQDQQVLIPWQTVFATVSARSLLRHLLDMGGPAPEGGPPPTPEDSMAYAIQSAMSTREVALHEGLLSDLRKSREAHNHHTGYFDSLPRDWAIEGELAYLGRRSGTNRAGDRVDIAFCRKIETLKQSRTGTPMFWCGIELKRGREGIAEIRRDAEKMRARCGLSILETCSLLVWGYTGDDCDDKVRGCIERDRATLFAPSRWIYLPVSAYDSMNARSDKWRWVFFGEVRDSREFAADRSARDDIRSRLFAEWQRHPKKHGYHRGEWAVDGMKCGVPTCSRCKPTPKRARPTSKRR